MRLTDLRDKKVVSDSGERLGRVHEVHCDGGRVTALKTGPGGLIERLTSKSKGRRIAWESVLSVGPDKIVVGVAKPSGSRTPPRTRRPSAPRSRR
jgi:sporulation protein YlmC with PRC-barrel domain